MKMETRPFAMNKSLTRIWVYLVLTLLVLGFIVIRFPGWLLNPNQLVERWGDGIKNYAAPWYHVLHDSSFAVYEGMNYPFGDHINTVDGQPLLSNSLKGLSGIFPGMGAYFPTLNNLAILCSLLMAAWLICYLFLEFGLPPWLAIVLGLLVPILCSQFDRVSHHFGLGHLAAVPLTLWILWKYWQHPNWARAIMIGAVVLFFSLIHLYFLLLLGALVGSFFLIEWLRQPNGLTTLQFFKCCILSLVFPAVLLLLWMHWTDPIEGRNAYPYGFFAYRAYLEGLFTNMDLPYFRWIDRRLIDIRNIGYEARNYVGLVAGLFFFIFLFSWLRARGRSFPLLTIRLEVGPFLFSLYLASLLLLLFSLGLPFIIPGFAPLLDYTGPLRQFRSIGRFAWDYYFIWQLLAWVALYHWTQRKSGRNWLLWLALSITAYEAIALSNKINTQLYEPVALEGGEQLVDLPIDFEHYQASITAPHYNIGSGNFWWPPEGFIIHHSLMLGVRTGLPTTSAMLTRTSLDHCLQQLQLVTPPYRAPEVLDHLPDQRPFLLMWDKKQVPLSIQNYQHLKSGAELLFDGVRMQLYRKPLESFTTALETMERQVREEIADSSLMEKAPFLAPNSESHFIYVDFDTFRAEQVYLGSGGLAVRTPVFKPIAEASLPTISKDSLYECSLWFYLKEPLAARSEIRLEELPQGSKKPIHRIDRSVHQYVQIIDSNGWGMVIISFKRRLEKSRLRLSIRNKDLRRRDLWVDEWLVQPKGQDLYRRLPDGRVWKNNLWWD